MSPREQIQSELSQRISENSYFSAPYGVIEGIDNLPKGGKVRTVTFGVARYLDAVAQIWSPKKITFRGQGGLAYKLPSEVSSIDEFFEKFFAPNQ